MRRCISLVQGQIAKDKMFKPARLKLKGLTTMLFQLQYGVYLASYASYTSQEASERKLNGNIASNAPNDIDEEA